MYEFDLDGTSIGRSGCVDTTVVTISIDGKPYTVPQLVKLKYEVESLRKEYVALNKDRSALQNINEGLQKQVYNYQDVIANNLTGIRCKELEGVIEELEIVIQDQQRELDIRSDEIHNLQTELGQLKECFKELLDVNHSKHAQVQDQQVVIEFQKSDIERLVKLNSELINEREELKSKQNLLGDYLKDFTATSSVKGSFGGKYASAVSGVIGETLVSVTFADNTGLSDTGLKFIESLINNKTDH